MIATNPEASLNNDRLHARSTFCLFAIISALSLIAGNLTSAETFNVGPGHSRATPSEVPWESLNAGDTVRIHWRQNPYLDKWVICRQGTALDPIAVIGIPGPNGERPVIEGNGATTRLALNYWNEQRGVIKIGGASVPSDTMPRHIIIDGLEIRGGRPPYDFSTDSGGTQSYSNNAAALYVEKGEHITIRNCVLHNCGNGLFVGASSSDILVESNHLYDNGIVGRIYEHNSYTATAGITYQFNRFGPLRVGAGGNNLKDRSAGTVIRYNWIEGGNRQLDLVDAEDSVALQQDPSYHSTFVYGNVLIEPDNSGNRQIIHYGGDSGNESIYRKGTLYLHHNTIISTRAGRSTLLRLSTNDETADCRNNIIYVTATGNQLEFLADEGTLNLSNNWLKSGAVDSFDSGFSGTITGKPSNITGTDPGFLNLNSQNFKLTSNSAAIDQAAPLNPSIVNLHSPLSEFKKWSKSKKRRQLGQADLGAFEFSPYTEWRSVMFGADSENDLISGEHADPDGDQICNLMEFAFQQNPLIYSLGPSVQSTWIESEGQQHFSIEFQRRPAPTGLIYRVEVSEDLETWSNGVTYHDTLPPTTSSILVDASSGGLTRAQLAQDLETIAKAFLRIFVDHQ